ncbi:uncharacterized protein PAC_17472 [Phialocephala subalpina]|uniref:Mid2 domain-containing protein n=1 Tax=Phialocephala subalpina TaxID=576137 RepID=A0A1L7XR99_9HELO|nr:uncharacterized protein PAC_17472 [Phialocephala subalpina]
MTTISTIPPLSVLPLLFLPSLFSTAQALQRAPRVQQLDVSRRATYNGGWALGLPGSTCPSDAPVACDTGSGSINPTCCPSGQTCSGSIRPYCCPSSADCVNVVQNVPVCANSSWDMYALTSSGSYFCCEPGQYGVLPLHGYAGICEPMDQAVASSLIATPASQVGGAAVTTVVSNSVNTVKSTATLTSTLSGGGVTTIVTAVGGSTATATSAGTGASSSSNPSGGATASITLTKGALIGICCGAAVILIAVVLLVWRHCLGKKKRRAAAANNNSNSNPGQGYAFPPGYSQGGQERMQNVQHQGTYTVSPISEYKTPVVGVSGYPTPPPPSAGGFSPPPQHQYGAFQGGQQQYGGSPSPSPNPGQMQGHGQVPGRVEAPGTPGPTLVEAPNAWERGLS